MEYNELTKQLLSEGYSANNYPAYVKIANSFNKDNPLDNFDGGFVYLRIHVDSFVYKTGCGCFVLGKNVINDLSYAGAEWRHENNNPVVFCPFKKRNCSKNHSLLQDASIGGNPLCVCHCTKDSYNYELSIEKLESDAEARKTAARDKFIAERNGHACIHHMHYDYNTEEWHMKYNPMVCAKQKCMGYCPIRGKELSHKRGNVYVDKKYAYQRSADIGTFFEGKVYCDIRKGVRFFPSPISIDICEEVAKKCEKDIKDHYFWNEGSHLQMLANPETLDIINIRAAAKPSRDLIQDLEDIKAGIAISHDSDQTKKFQEQKKKRREEAFLKKKKALAKKIVSAGLNSLEPFHSDYKNAHKWFSAEELEELKVLHLNEMKKASYHQITLFDIQPQMEVNTYENY